MSNFDLDTIKQFQDKLASGEFSFNPGPLPEHPPKIKIPDDTINYATSTFKEQADDIANQINQKTDEEISVLRQQLKVAINDAILAKEAANSSDKTAKLSILLSIVAIIISVLTLLKG